MLQHLRLLKFSNSRHNVSVSAFIGRIQAYLGKPAQHLWVAALESGSQAQGQTLSPPLAGGFRHVQCAAEVTRASSVFTVLSAFTVGGQWGA